MKKSLLIILCLIGAMSMNAQVEYRNSIGGTVGTAYGFSYKCLPMGPEGLAIEADLSFCVGRGATNSNGANYSFGYWTFQANPNFMYQKPCLVKSAGSLSWYAGGGTSLGLASNYRSTNITGKFGLNAIGGVEWAFSNCGLALSGDFRPGYGMLFSDRTQLHFFDWGLVFGIRHYF